MVKIIKISVTSLRFSASNHFERDFCVPKVESGMVCGEHFLFTRSARSVAGRLMQPVPEITAQNVSVCDLLFRRWLLLLVWRSRRLQAISHTETTTHYVTHIFSVCTSRLRRIQSRLKNKNTASGAFRAGTCVSPRGLI